MTFATIFALFGAMVVLALVPGPAVVAVTSRAMSSGFSHGASTTIGIVLGDYVFVLLSISGLAFIAETMGNLFVAIKYLGAAYLVWLGIGLLRSRGTVENPGDAGKSSHFANLLLGLATTLGNPKAILFYLSFFPAFLNMQQISAVDLFCVLLVVTIAVGSVNLGYAYLAARTGGLIKIPPGPPRST
ncbi:LysE family translocator [Microbulbifer taiwanensis]|uniref:LysE family translocator n=1 Tax=Microbulbifer taiwanensis TaxID=986746 RepID=UPI00360D9594